MKITYELSGRQRKELIERGRPLSIAIPAPMDEEYDELAYARASLPTLEPQWIRSAEETTLPVWPLEKGPGLAGMLGSIQPEGADVGWLVPMLAVVCAIQTDERPRHRAGPTQWAAALLLDGEKVI